MSQSIAAVLLLHQWIERQAMPDALAWLDERVISLSTEPLSNFTASFAKIARRLGKAALDLTDEDTREAYEKCDGWQAEGLTIDQAGRILLIVEAASVQPAEIFQQRLKSLLTTADVGERIAIYRGLPLYPASEAVVGIALDGLRTSVEAIFESIAHRNCFPARHFSEPAWNQMVLKALFVGSRLDPIVGLDARWNSDLARMLFDYAHERRAAGRLVSPELWRGVGRFADERGVADLEALLASDDPTSQHAAALALAENATDQSARVLMRHPDLAAATRASEISWQTISQQLSKF